MDEKIPGGYILLHRKFLSSSFYQRPFVTRLFTHILMSVNHHPGEVLVRNVPVQLQPGQGLMSVRKLAVDTGISVQSVRSALALLCRCGALKSTHQVTRGPTVVTVCNWGLYQHVPCDANTATNTPPTHRQHTANTATVKGTRVGEKVKKGNKGEKGKEHPPPSLNFQLTESILDLYREAFGQPASPAWRKDLLDAINAGAADLLKSVTVEQMRQSREWAKNARMPMWCCKTFLRALDQIGGGTSDRRHLTGRQEYTCEECGVRIEVRDYNNGKQEIVGTPCEHMEKTQNERRNKKQ